ncbi:MAG: tetratricopeptide repeat protein, partial [Elusimicrobia bacterium]|nr:tetratricopeptide repeat protein [Elusimicrobiota bacterium]
FAYADSLGWVYFKQGKYDEAVQELLRAAELNPQDDTTRDHLGQAFMAAPRPDFEQAWLNFKLSKSANPQRPGIDSKISEAEAKIPQTALAQLYMNYLGRVFGTFTKFSALVFIEGSAAGKTSAFDGIFAYKWPDKMTLDLMGPMFAPLWSVKYNPRAAQGKKFETQSGEVFGEYRRDFESVAETLISMLWDYYSGEVFNGKAEFSAQKDLLKTEKYNIYLNSSQTSPAFFEPSGKRKIKIELSDFRRYSGRLVPVELKFTAGRLSVRVKITRFEAGFKDDKKN